jgi:hypothetical protein
MICSDMADGTPSLTAAPTDAAAGGAGEACARPLVERQLEALGELADIGLKLARAVERQVSKAEAPSVADLNAAAMAYARVARAVRQSVMLQSRLQAEQHAATAGAGGLRARVARIVRRAIEDQHGEAEQTERLCAEAAERLEQERYGDLLARPVGEIVADICKDLGLSPDWRGLADELAAAEAFARGEAGDAIASADQDTGPIELDWIGPDGRLPPASKLFPNRYKPRPYDPSRDPARRPDTS